MHVAARRPRYEKDPSARHSIKEELKELRVFGVFGHLVHVCYTGVFWTSLFLNTVLDLWE